MIINKIYTQSIICKFNRNLLQVLFKYLKKTNSHIILHITSGQYTGNSYTVPYRSRHEQMFLAQWIIVCKNFLYKKKHCNKKWETAKIKNMQWQTYSKMLQFVKKKKVLCWKQCLNSDIQWYSYTHYAKEGQLRETFDLTDISL